MEHPKFLTEPQNSSQNLQNPSQNPQNLFPNPQNPIFFSPKTFPTNIKVSSSIFRISGSSSRRCSRGRYWRSTGSSGILGTGRKKKQTQKKTLSGKSGNIWDIPKKFPPVPPKIFSLTLHLLLGKVLGAGQGEQQQRERVHIGAQQPLVVLWEF